MRKPIEGFPGYEIDDGGVVWSEWAKRLIHDGSPRRLRGTVGYRSGAWKPIKCILNQKGYCIVNLKRGDTVVRCILVHQLVLEAFVGPCPDSCETRHLNGVPNDNRLCNLAWGTKIANMADRTAHGRTGIGEKHHNAKLLPAQVLDIRARRQNGERTADLAVEFKVSIHCIKDIVQRRSWSHLPV